MIIMSIVCPVTVICFGIFRIHISQIIKGVLHLLPQLACFVLHLNTFLKNNVCII